MAKIKTKTASLLDRVPVILAAATFAALLLSVVYEWGYFRIIGPEFQTFETTTDYLSNAVLYLPANAIITMISALFVWVIVWPISALTQTKKKKRFDSHFHTWRLLLGFFVVFFILPLWTFLIGDITLWEFIASCLVGIALVVLFQTPNEGQLNIFAAC